MVRKRRFSQVSTSSDEDEPKKRSSRKEKILRHDDDEDVAGDGNDEKSRPNGGGDGGVEAEDVNETRTERKSSRKKKIVRAAADDEKDSGADDGEEKSETKEGGDGGGEEEEAEENVEEEDTQAVPIGDPIRVSGKGKKRKTHYSSFEYEGNVFELEDPVLLSPESEDEKPYVAIIKDIADSGNGLMVTGQWFYRPEEAAKKGGGYYQARDTRELFYSFHLDDVPAESVMHRCIVHFVPLNKKLPVRSQHPGFIVQKVYDTVEKKLFKLTDKDYEDCKQDELNQLVNKTMERLGELPDVVPEDAPADRCDQPISKWNLRRKNMPPIDTSRADGASIKSPRAETPASCPSDASVYYLILAKFKALTGDSYRDRWLEKLLQGIRQACNPKEDAPKENGENASKGNRENASKENGENTSKENGEKDGTAVSTYRANGNTDVEKRQDACESFCWPDSAVASITALEKASHETLGSDFQKYNQKMRQLVFNFKNNALLARRLLKKELDPAVILSMSPNELKEGRTADEKTTKEPEKSEHIQMTDARCSRCTEKRVAVTDIIHAGGHGNRYQLECQACGHSWYASGDAISSLTIDAPNPAGNVGTAPWATAKFEDVEKKLVSPRDPEKASVDVFQKSTAAYMPALEPQKSFNRSKNDETLATTAPIRE
ncbi:uncharacterized protein A4U43_C07F21190 [Asparagus officinalis]|uniref:BAH domain-containing protein n=1 Tax=Asparagus officinalis TaxID=4686 RepID=A0A5P1EH32_ASPOF|nr:uncharacterized protein LOC109848660 [Asparagus officinalis]ONK64011.1 uncharacterized protein A4U43_C07F21190 [Asparagus officinalis]